MHSDQDKKQAVPFFARYLEEQFPRVRTDVKAGGVRGTGSAAGIDVGSQGGATTMKWPSDDDEIGIKVG